MSEELSIIIPVLNEEKNIKPLTYKIKKNLKNHKFEIIFVDDSSTDDSKKTLKKLKNRYKFFRPIFRNKKKDLTKSCFEGIENSKFKNILIMDGDLQHDPKYIPKMIAKLKSKNLDLVIGARKLFHKKNKGLSETRRFASIILIYLFKVFNIRTVDPMSGYFLFKKKIYYRNKKNFFSKGFKILADLLINCNPKLKTSDVFIDFKRRYKSTSKMNSKILLILIQFYLISLTKKLLV